MHIGGLTRVVFSFLLACGLAAGCGKAKDKDQPSRDAKTRAAAEKAKPDPAQGKDKSETAQRSRSLLVTMSQFKPDDKGQYTVPDRAVMLVIAKENGKWKTERVEDTQSNVFHKAVQYKDEGILTIGANEAQLKLWNKEGGEWVSQTLWKTEFGGKHNRLRDFELGDFDGDGADDLAIATHDQGVVAVVWNKDGKWVPEEIDRHKDTFVHEIEVGDLDKDGKLEIYATPSEPNTASGKDQGGKIVRYAWNGEKFERSEVVSLSSRHIKEILVADIEKDGTSELYASLEAETDGATIKAPVEIRRYDLKDGTFESSQVATINDRFLRFLVAGDIDHDGRDELVAAAFSAGVWVIEKTDEGWEPKSIAKDSGGFEHAAYIADIEDDGRLELYVADDNSGSLNRYDFEDGAYKKEVVWRRPVPSSAMVWNITVAD